MSAALIGHNRGSNILRQRRLLAAFLLIGLFILLFSSNTYREISAAGMTDQGRLHGGIEIDPEGIKAAVIRASDPEQGSGAEIVYTEVFNTALTRNQNGKFTLEVIKTAAQAVLRLFTRMQQQYQVPQSQVYVIGSSDLDAENLADLANEVRNATGKTMT
ncbi:MAG: hypothetical protein L0312_02830, partial [Acidobacteria bacterium]|nr:hypothetical protein [Acidobacteriota bacterium]